MSTDVAVNEHNQTPAVRQDAGGITPSSMIQLAIEKGASIDQLEKLMALQERSEANEARKAFVHAMTRFKRTVPDIHKNKSVNYSTNKGGKTAYDHATLDHICSTVNEPLAEVGISYRWVTENLDGGWIRVTCLITHEMGHSAEATLQGPHDQSGGKNNIQAIGSTTEYLRRYTLLSALGLAVKGMDNDAAAPVEQQPAQQRNARPAQTHEGQSYQVISEGQRRQLIAQGKMAGQSEADICRIAHLKSLNEMAAHRFPLAMKHLKKMLEEAE